MQRLKKVLKIIGYIAFVFAFVFATANLFFEKEVKWLENYLDKKSEVIVGNEQIDAVTVVLPREINGFEPTDFDWFTRQVLNNIYEPLVRPDKDLNIEPCLALSFGMLSDNLWEFVLRPGVKFHDGSLLNTNDVIESFDRAKNYENSTLKDLLSNIKSVVSTKENVVLIETYKPDPLLLQKVATVYISPGDDYIGTAPYELQGVSDGIITLKSFDGYWGGKPVFKQVSFVSISNPDGRVKIMNDGKADVLVYAPYDYLKDVSSELNIYPGSSLEVQMIIFNVKNGVFKDQNARFRVTKVLDREGFAEFLGQYVVPSFEYVAAGVFGYDNKIKPVNYNLNISKFSGEKIKVCLPEQGFDVLGDYLEKQLRVSGAVPEIKYLDAVSYQKALIDGDFDIYFIAFRSELGDASDFLVSVVHTMDFASGFGNFNFGGYSNATVDEYVEKQLTELDSRKRLIYLQEAMKIITNEDLIGVPLFEYEYVTVTKDSVNYEPRKDGYVYVNDLIR